MEKQLKLLIKKKSSKNPHRLNQKKQLELSIKKNVENFSSIKPEQLKSFIKKNHRKVLID